MNINNEEIKELKKTLYSAITIDTFYKYCLERYPHVNLRRILTRAGIEEYEIVDPGHWFSDEQVDRFYGLLVEATGNQNLAREAGRYAAAPGTMGILRQYTLGLIG